MDLRKLSIAGFCLLLPPLAALYVRGSLLGAGPLAVAIQALAVLLMIWARVTFGLRSFHLAASPTEGGLVTRGPYHYLRHPIYAAVLYFVWAGVGSHWSLWNCALGLTATGGLALRMFAEEKLVTAQYPEYLGYARRTSRVVPFATGLSWL